MFRGLFVSIRVGWGLMIVVCGSRTCDIGLVTFSCCCFFVKGVFFEEWIPRRTGVSLYRQIHIVVRGE